MFFETIKIFNSQAYNLEYHERIMKRTIGAKLSFSLSEALMCDDDCKDGLFEAKIIYDLSGNFIGKEIKPFKIQDISKIKIIHSTIDYDKKYCDRSEIDNLLLQKEDADDIIIVKDGFVTDASNANVALMVANKWYTPKHPLINGSTRLRFLERGFLQERDFNEEDLKSASKIAFLSSMLDFYIIKDPIFI